MKAIYITFTACLLLTSCNNSHRKQDVQLPDIIQATADKPDTVEVDAVTSATSHANEMVLNGTFVLSPQRKASVTLSVDGIVKNTSLLPGMYVRKGELLATLENPEFINLQQNYLDACAQSERG